ncbi:Tubulin-folding cofactor B [Camellia lanceoleosa]|uniref:Tubulin-folding cofactor B n=1 Tax=Camellia lanceoleosa TaxID=1840588 RepID=A0ACC0HR19_9ERIC|nr:Tubulin-folding cofactor B [Camellia lanceoleosa]
MGSRLQIEGDESVLLRVTHSNLKSFASDVRFSLHKEKLWKKCGTSVNSMCLELYDDMGAKISDMSDNLRPLGFYSPQDGGIAISPAKASVENLTLKAQLQEVELEAVNEVIKSLTAGNRSSGQSRQGLSETTTRNGGRTKEGDSRDDNEWVVQDKPGVYITRTSLPGGVKDLTRVRFSIQELIEPQE